MIGMTDADYEQLYKSMISLIQENATNLDALRTTIGSGFRLDNLENLTTCFADKKWFMDNVRGANNTTGLTGLSSVWKNTNKDIAKTAEILFGAWYTKIMLIAFYTVCLNSIKKRVEKAGQDGSLVGSWLNGSSRNLISTLLGGGYNGDHTEFVIDLRDIDIEETEYSIDVRFDVPDIFYSTSLKDIIAGNININTVLFWNGTTNIGKVADIPLKDLGIVVKRYILDRISQLIAQYRII